MAIEHRRDRFLISTDPALLDLDAIHAFLKGAYWCQGIPRETLTRAFANSLTFGLYRDERQQIGLARVISDFATYAYLCDVYVLEEWRGQGLGTWLIDCVLAHPGLAGLRRFSLVTRDAHALYSKFGFNALANPSRHMEVVHPDLYLRSHRAEEPTSSTERSAD